MKKAQLPYSCGAVKARYPGYQLYTFKIVKFIRISYSLVVLAICMVIGGTYPLHILIK